ncbi:hypothetical protein Pcinc_041104 [Petrolisthes cinctipes]|uniref:Uncharacterized protein n=1 Tax=Petrolisthes cinctipes TaxID=88211 RepID=A0AAE1BLI5_PETCI|nr:hypothetical protein Pcinc_041104 [Petrolisthes cinctipes]
MIMVIGSQSEGGSGSVGGFKTVVKADQRHCEENKGSEGLRRGGLKWHIDQKGSVVDLTSLIHSFETWVDVRFYSRKYCGHNELPNVLEITQGARVNSECQG